MSDTLPCEAHHPQDHVASHHLSSALAEKKTNTRQPQRLKSTCAEEAESRCVHLAKRPSATSAARVFSTAIRAQNSVRTTRMASAYPDQRKLTHVPQQIRLQCQCREYPDCDKHKEHAEPRIRGSWSSKTIR